MNAGAKVSKVVSVTPHGVPYAPMGSQVVNKQAYRVVFEDGADGYMEGMLNSAPVLVGKQYAYVTSQTKSGNTKVELVAMPATSVAPTEKVSPQLQTPTRSFADAAAATSKATPEQLAAEAASDQTQKNLVQSAGHGSPIPGSIPDNKPRTGKVKSIKQDGDFTPKDGQKQFKYVVTMEDGAVGVMWTPETMAPVKEGQEINYTFDKVYQDGSKRIAMAAIGASVDKETMIMRMACLNTAVAFLAAQNTQVEHYPVTMNNLRIIAMDLEQHVTRSND